MLTPGAVLSLLHQRLQVHCVLEKESAYGQSGQPRQVSPCSQEFTQIIGQGADIGPLGARGLERYEGGMPFDDFETRDFDLARLARYGDAFSCELVEGSPLMLYRRVHGRGLDDVPHKVGEGAFDGIESEHACVVFANDLPLGIPGIGDDAQVDLSEVGLVPIRQIFDDTCGLAQAYQQHARGHWVERARVTDAPLTRKASHPGYDIVRCQSTGLVDIEHTDIRRVSTRTVKGRHVEVPSQGGSADAVFEL